MVHRIPIAQRLHAVKLHCEHGLILREAAQAVGASRRSLIRWLKQYAPQKSFNAFSPIVLHDDEVFATFDDVPPDMPVSTPLSSPILVAVSTSDGSIVRFQLSFNDLVRLIHTLNQP